MGLAKELVASIDSCAPTPSEGLVRQENGDQWHDEISAHGSRLISGLSYKTAFNNELLTSIFPL
jgi:hypothetical protein